MKQHHDQHQHNAHAHAVHAVHTHIVHAVHAHAVHAVHAHAVHAVKAHAVHAHAGVVLRRSCDSVLCICSSSGGVCEQSSSTCSVLSHACASLLGLQGLLLFTLLMLTQALFSDAAATASYVDALAVVEFVSTFGRLWEAPPISLTQLQQAMENPVDHPALSQLYNTLLSCVLLDQVLPRFATLCPHATLCHAVPCFATLCSG